MFLFSRRALKMTRHSSEEDTIPRIAVIGAGAVGSGIGALLHRAGQNVVLIGRSAHVAAIRQEGLRVDGCMGTFIAPVEAAEALTNQAIIEKTSSDNLP